MKQLGQVPINCQCSTHLDLALAALRYLHLFEADVLLTVKSEGFHHLARFRLVAVFVNVHRHGSVVSPFMVMMYCLHYVQLASKRR